MSHELYFTSAPSGLRPGSNGYCTVAATRGLPGPLQQKLEALSDYRPLFDDAESADGRLPVALTHLRITMLGKTWSVLSRSCMAGVDHTRRRVFFTHHVALEAAELPPGGPAWLLSQHGFLETRWDGQVRELSAGRRPVMGNGTLEVCRAWQQAVGDAGWAGMLAEEFEKNPNRPIYLLYPLNLDPLPLLLEAISLLPPERRWQVTFSTLYQSLPQDVSCVWRCLPLEAPEARKVRSMPGVMVFDLGRPFGPADGGGPLVTAARTGMAPRLSSPGPIGPAAPQPPRAGAWWKPGPVSAPVATEPEPEPVPMEPVEPEPRPAEVSVPEKPEFIPEPQAGSWLVPFAAGLFVGMLLIGGGTVAAWRVLKEGNAKTLAEAIHQAEQDRLAALNQEKDAAALAQAAAIKSAEEAAEREKAQAIQNIKAIAAVKRANDIAKTKQEIEAAANRERSKLARQIEMEQLEKDKAIALRNAANAALETLTTKVFSENAKEAKDLRGHLTSIQKGRAGKPIDLAKLVDEWLKHEIRSLRDPRIQDLKNVLVYLQKRDTKIPPIAKEWKQAVNTCDALLKDTESVLVRKELARIKVLLDRMDPAKRP